LAEKYIIEQPHKTNTMSNSGGCRTRKQQVADAGQATLGEVTPNDTKVSLIQLIP